MQNLALHQNGPAKMVASEARSPPVFLLVATRGALLVASLAMAIALLSTMALPPGGAASGPREFHLSLPAAGLIACFVAIVAVILLSTIQLAARRRAERALRESDARLAAAAEAHEAGMAERMRETELRAILDMVPDALVTIDGAGRIRSFSANAERLFGHAARDVVGRDASLLMPRKFRAIYRRLIDRQSGTGEYLPVGPARRWTALHRDGSEIPVGLSAGEARSGRERILTLFVRDRREQIADQARLAKLRDELLHVSRLSAMGEMAAGLAHELNQPLAAMSNFVGAASLILAKERHDKDRVAELLKLTASQAMRAGEIIQRVRSFAAKGEVEFGAQRLDALIADSLDLALTSTERRRIDIRTEIDPRHATVFADRVQIQQVLINMTRNAIEAMTDAKTHRPQIVFVTRGAADDMVEIAVNDNGPGIPFDVLNRHHAHFASSKAYGMGIGLSICRRIVEAHRGQLSTENLRGAGAVVRFTVPAFGEMERKAS